MSKYHAKKVTYNGKTFDSKRERKRYTELLLLERAGAISELELQKRYELIPAQYEAYERYGKNGKRLKDGQRCIEKPVFYVADFAYKKPVHFQYENEHGHTVFADGWETIVEDVKGYKGSTAYAVFAIKRKLMLLVHKIKVKEV